MQSLAGPPAARVKLRRLQMDDVWRDNSLGLDATRVIDRRIYLEEKVLAAEQERIFAKTWQWVAHESEIPEFGDYVTTSIAGRAIVVARSESDRITAFYNTCTHRGAMLAHKARGKSDGGFVCLYHGWCFDTEGKLTAAPLPDAYGANLRKKCYDIPQVRSETFEGNIFVCLDENIAPLEEFLGEAGPYLKTYLQEGVALGRVRWTLEGNWKLWHENFRDNYHPMFAHLVLGFNYQGVKIEGQNLVLDDGHSLLTFPSQGNPDRISSSIGKITGRPITGGAAVLARRPTEGPRTQHSILAVFPNLDVQHATHPDASPYLQTVRPLGVNKAVVEIVVFGKTTDTAEERQARLDNALDGQAASGKISGDDNEAARRCMIGFSTADAVRWSNMDRGQAPGREGEKNDEYSLREFYRAYKRYMGDVLDQIA
jgi:phenylpropionate dioxygenase-like ring-hydroxylating dioxygenase large terminal subunit